MFSLKTNWIEVKHINVCFKSIIKCHANQEERIGIS